MNSAFIQTWPAVEEKRRTESYLYTRKIPRGPEQKRDKDTKTYIQKRYYRHRKWHFITMNCKEMKIVEETAEFGKRLLGLSETKKGRKVE